MCEISVIITVYNMENYIEQTVKSVLANSFIDYELLIIDDGSTDESVKRIKKYEEIDSRVKIIEKENGGTSTARNLGIENAKGKYIAFIDGDDIVSKDYLKMLHDAAVEHNLDWVYSTFAELELKGEETYAATDASPTPPWDFLNNDKLILDNAKDQLLKMVFKTETRKNLFSNCLCLYKREIIMQNNLRLKPEIKIGEDVVFNYEYAHYVNRFKYIHKACYLYVQRDNSIMHISKKNINIKAEFMHLKESAKLIEYYGDEFTEEFKDYAFNKSLKILKSIFELDTHKERKEAFRDFAKCKGEEPLKEVMDSINPETFNGYTWKIILALFKADRYELLYYGKKISDIFIKSQ